MWADIADLTFKQPGAWKATFKSASTDQITLEFRLNRTESQGFLARAFTNKMLKRFTHSLGVNPYGIYWTILSLFLVLLCHTKVPLNRRTGVARISVWIILPGVARLQGFRKGMMSEA